MPSTQSSSSSHARVMVKLLKLGRIPKSSQDPMKAYVYVAKWIARGMHTFMSISSVFYAGLSEELGLDEHEGTEGELQVFDAIVGRLPNFEGLLSEFRKDPMLLDLFVAKMSAAANTARQEDTGSIRYDALAYICRQNEILNPPITKDLAKSSRGFNHPSTARLLCPMRRLAEFKEDPITFMTMVNDGQIAIKASKWPSFMYDEDEYDEERAERGLCKGYFLVRVYRHIFTGPSSAISKHTQASKPSKAQLHGLLAVTARTIAYAAVQARFVLCTLEKWTQYDGDFDHEALYNNIVALFESRPDHPWVHETYAWWDKQVPGLKHRLKKQKKVVEEHERDSGDEDAVNEILAQWSSEADNKMIDDDIFDDTRDQPEGEDDAKEIPARNRLYRRERRREDGDDKTDHRRAAHPQQQGISEHVQSSSIQKSGRQVHPSQPGDQPTFGEGEDSMAGPPRYRRNKSALSRPASDPAVTACKSRSELKHISRPQGDRDDIDNKDDEDNVDGALSESSPPPRKYPARSSKRPRRFL